MKFKNLIKDLSKISGESTNLVKAGIADELGNTIQTINLWESGKVLPTIINTHNLYLYIKRKYKLDINIFDIFIKTYKK